MKLAEPQSSITRGLGGGASGTSFCKSEPLVDIANPRADQPFDACLSGTALREARRLRGLSQIELAELLNISQSRVSAWERGYDDVPNRQRHRLIDIMSNRSGVLNPLLKKLVKFNPHLAIYEPTVSDGLADFRWLHIANFPQMKFLANRSEFIGKRISEFFNIKWCSEVQPDGPFAGHLMIDVERDVKTNLQHGGQCLYRMRSRQIFVDFEGHSQLVLAHHTMCLESAGQPDRIYSTLRLDDLDR